MNDWTGNGNSVFKTLGASSHTEKEREQDDYYATDPYAIDILVDAEDFKGTIWEPACGEGHLSKRLIERGYDVISSDLINRGYGDQTGANADFLIVNEVIGIQNIITNPPYKYALEFCQQAYKLVPVGGKVAMFLKLTFLEGKKRKEFFLNHPPKTVYVSSSRLLCARNGDFKQAKADGGSAVAYGWFIWEKGFIGETTIKWVN